MSNMITGVSSLTCPSGPIDPNVNNVASFEYDGIVMGDQMVFNGAFDVSLTNAGWGFDWSLYYDYDSDPSVAAQKGAKANPSATLICSGQFAVNNKVNVTDGMVWMPVPFMGVIPAQSGTTLYIWMEFSSAIAGENPTGQVNYSRGTIMSIGSSSPQTA